METFHEFLRFFAAIGFVVLGTAATFCAIFTGITVWLSDLVKRVKTTTLGRTVCVILFLAWTYGAVLNAVDYWKDFRRESPLKTDAINLAYAIERDIRLEIQPFNILHRYDSQIRRVVPLLLGSGPAKEIDSLSKVYENIDINPHSLTNLSHHIRAAANTID